MEMENYTQALKFHDRSLKIREGIHDRPGIAISLNNIGLVYKDMKSYKKATAYFKQSLKIKEELNDKHGIAVSLYSIGEVHREQGNNNEAISFGSRSLVLGLEEGDVELNREIADLLYKSYKTLGNGVSGP